MKNSAALVFSILVFYWCTVETNTIITYYLFYYFFFIFIFLTLYERYVLTHKKRWVRSSISPLPFWQRHISYVFPPFLFYYRTILLFICFFFVVVVERNNRNRKDRTKYNLQLAGSMQKVKKKGTGEKKKGMYLASHEPVMNLLAGCARLSCPKSCAFKWQVKERGASCLCLLLPI